MEVERRRWALPISLTYLATQTKDGLKFSQKSFELGMHPQLISRN
jgi:hypothetical protein